jgi:hypothetical protein
MLDGVEKYINGTATIRVHISADKPVCQFCPHIQFDSRLDRATCGLNGEFITNPTKRIDYNCPIVFDSEKQTTIQIKESELPL